MMLRNHFSALILVSGLLMFSLQSQAGCVFNKGYSAVNNIVSLPDMFIPIPRNATPGTALGSKIAITNGTNTQLKCDANASGYYYMMLALASPGIETSTPRVYPTDLAGIGVKIWSEFSGVYELDNEFDTPQAWYGTYNSSGTAVYVNRGIKSVYLQYYVTGPITAGVATLKSELVAWADSEISGVTSGLTYARMTINGTATFNYVTCETPNITVDLQKHNVQELFAVGVTSTPTPFNFVMNNCPKNLSSVNYTFRPAPGINLAGTGTGSYLTLSGDSTADGVGIQMLYDDETLVPFNNKIQYTGYVKATGGSYTIPMKARYIRTGPLRPGTANSAVEFDMTYE
ncbi:hypothetical protein TUM17576_54420 [Enterobacter hormaechei]|uniref:Fimbrial protein n=1 Tax=Phytobacter ursingii TaxID=1972431 RepID=A0AB35RNZ9_9ENTR|nr:MULTISPECIES: fimbrial protein [Enterobacteriaceae]MDV2861767.1 fimbrial protein [Phytobacter ursingii]GJL38622.1 hypothetical protein TUM17576_54420 [Enterobacter hormaechei]